jgi:translation initiation factor IF-2
MAKMRVHELAKELNIKSQDIIETLSTTEYAVKSASSGVDDAAQAVVRDKYGKKTEAPKAESVKEKPKTQEKKTEDKKAEQKKPEDGKASGENKERPKKKSSISAVFNAQYSKQSRRSGQGGNGRGGNGNGRGQRRDGAQRPEQHSIIRPRPVGERAMRPISERTANNVDEFEESRPSTNKPAEKQNSRNNGGNNNNNRPRGERPSRPNNERGSRQSTDRPARGGADRNDRGNNRSQNDRNNNRGGNNRFNKEVAAAAPEETRGKDSRNNNDRRNNNNNHRKDRDKLGGKRQENYINLEKHGGKKKPQQQPKPKEEEDVIKTITLPEKMTIRDLADKMKIQPSVIVKKLFLKGQMVTVNQEVDFDTAEEIALEFNYICEPEEKIDVIAELLKEEEENVEDMVSRPPVVCVMGHVDHGKTSLLDAIRSTRVTDREAGGITQHIGASVVSINGQNITFLDTPGHEAFTAMRMRGANSTDIAILVVAADDGVMPQTVEAINHARAAGVEIIVAVNKIDKPSANIEKVKQELSEYELIPEDWGGSTIFCPVSAHTGEGIDNLLEMILLTAEVLELKANPNRNARGLVIEAQLDKGRGAVATILVQKGTLHVGDSVACGSSYGKVRAMIDDKGQRVKKAIPSTPVEILGLNSVPAAGETFVVCDSDKEAKAFADTYISEEKNRLIEDTKAKMSLDDLFSQIQSGNMKELDIIVKADVQGSVEAVKQSLVKLSNEEVVVKVIHGGVGAINESDVILASASNAIIIGFNVRPDPIAKVTADNEGVDVRLYKVIYNAIEDVEAAMKGMLDPIFEEKVLGHAEIRQIFKASGVGNIAGSYVLDGVMERGCRVRISREGEQIFEGDLASLKRFKDDVKEVKTGYECGLVFDGFNDIQELDVVEAYKMVEVPR